MKNTDLVSYNKLRGIKKFDRELKYKNKLEFANKYLYHFPRHLGVRLIESSHYKTITKPYYKRSYTSSHLDTKWYKRFMNHKVRRFHKHLLDGCSYKKIYDYYWNILY